MKEWEMGDGKWKTGEGEHLYGDMSEYDIALCNATFHLMIFELWECLTFIVATCPVTVWRSAAQISRRGVSRYHHGEQTTDVLER